MPISGVPVNLFGQHIASATINDDGTIQLTMEGPNALGKALLGNLEGGHYGGIEMTVMPVALKDQAPDGTRKNRGQAKKDVENRPLSSFGGFVMDAVEDVAESTGKKDK